MAEQPNSNPRFKKAPLKITSWVVLCLFLFNTLAVDSCLAQVLSTRRNNLSIWSFAERNTLREALARTYIESRLIRVADSEFDCEQLRRYNAQALLQPSGKYLMEEATRKDPLKFIRAVTEEDFRILLRLEGRNAATRGRYLKLLSEILYVPTVLTAYNRVLFDAPTQSAPSEDILESLLSNIMSMRSVTKDEAKSILFNDIMALAFEIQFLLREKIIAEAELTAAEREFLAVMKPALGRLEAKDASGRYINLPRLFFDKSERIKFILRLQKKKAPPEAANMAKKAGPPRKSAIQPTVETFGRLVTKKRTERGMTIRASAALAKISRSYLRRIEKGKIPRPNAAILRRMASLLEIDESKLPYMPMEDKRKKQVAALKSTANVPAARKDKPKVDIPAEIYPQLEIILANSKDSDAEQLADKARGDAQTRHDIEMTAWEKLAHPTRKSPRSFLWGDDVRLDQDNCLKIKYNPVTWEILDEYNSRRLKKFICTISSSDKHGLIVDASVLIDYCNGRFKYAADEKLKKAPLSIRQYSKDPVTELKEELETITVNIKRKFSELKIPKIRVSILMERMKKMREEIVKEFKGNFILRVAVQRSADSDNGGEESAEPAPGAANMAKNAEVPKGDAPLVMRSQDSLLGGEPFKLVTKKVKLYKDDIVWNKELGYGRVISVTEDKDDRNIKDPSAKVSIEFLNDTMAFHASAITEGNIWGHFYYCVAAKGNHRALDSFEEEKERIASALPKAKRPVRLDPERREKMAVRAEGFLRAASRAAKNPAEDWSGSPSIALIRMVANRKAEFFQDDLPDIEDAFKLADQIEKDRKRHLYRLENATAVELFLFHRLISPFSSPSASTFFIDKVKKLFPALLQRMRIDRLSKSSRIKKGVIDRIINEYLSPEIKTPPSTLVRKWIRQGYSRERIAGWIRRAVPKVEIIIKNLAQELEQTEEQSRPEAANMAKDSTAPEGQAPEARKPYIVTVHVGSEIKIGGKSEESVITIKSFGGIKSRITGKKCRLCTFGVRSRVDVIRKEADDGRVPERLTREPLVIDIHRFTDIDESMEFKVGSVRIKLMPQSNLREKIILEIANPDNEPILIDDIDIRDVPQTETSHATGLEKEVRTATREVRQKIESGKYTSFRVLHEEHPALGVWINGILRKLAAEFERLPNEKSTHMSFSYSPVVGDIATLISKAEGPKRDGLFAKFVSMGYKVERGEHGIALIKNPDAKLWLVSDGSAVLGLGDLGHLAMGPVAVGKVSLLEWLGGVECNILLVDTSKGDKAKEIIAAVRDLKRKHAGIAVMLEDIGAPECYAVESELNCPTTPGEPPVFAIHDDQHATAIVFASAVINALKKQLKKIKLEPEDFKGVRIVLYGAGAAGSATAMLLDELSGHKINIIAFDTQGLIYEGRTGISDDPRKQKVAEFNRDHFRGGLKEALLGASGFIGLSRSEEKVGALYGKEKILLSGMCKGAFVFAGSNPYPEFNPAKIARLKKRGMLKNIDIVAVGRFGDKGISTLNNCYSFPGVFRAVIDLIEDGLLREEDFANASRRIEVAATLALIDLCTQDDLYKGRPITPLFTESGYNTKITEAVAKAVYAAFSSQEQAQTKYRGLAEKLSREHAVFLQDLPQYVRDFFEALRLEPTPAPPGPANMAKEGPVSQPAESGKKTAPFYKDFNEALRIFKKGQIKWSKTTPDMRREFVNILARSLGKDPGALNIADFNKPIPEFNGKRLISLLRIYCNKHRLSLTEGLKILKSELGIKETEPVVIPYKNFKKALEVFKNGEIEWARTTTPMRSKFVKMLARSRGKDPGALNTKDFNKPIPEFNGKLLIGLLAIYCDKGRRKATEGLKILKSELGIKEIKPVVIPYKNFKEALEVFKNGEIEWARTTTPMRSKFVNMLARSRGKDPGALIPSDFNKPIPEFNGKRPSQLLVIYCDKHRLSLTEGLKILKSRLGIIDSLTQSQWKEKKRDWGRVCRIINETMGVSVDITNVTLYLEEARITKEADIALGREVQCGDSAAKDALIDAYKKNVRSQAKNIARTNKDITEDELFDVGLFALSQSIERYDPNRGIALWSFVGSRINSQGRYIIGRVGGAMRDYIRVKRGSRRKHSHGEETYRGADDGNDPESREGYMGNVSERTDTGDIEKAEAEKTSRIELARSLLQGKVSKRDLEIFIACLKGEKQYEIASRFNLGASRISNIVRDCRRILEEKLRARPGLEEVTPPGPANMAKAPDETSTRKVPSKKGNLKGDVLPGEYYIGGIEAYDIDLDQPGITEPLPKEKRQALEPTFEALERLRTTYTGNRRWRFYAVGNKVAAGEDYEITLNFKFEDRGMPEGIICIESNRPQGPFKVSAHYGDSVTEEVKHIPVKEGISQKDLTEVCLEAAKAILKANDFKEGAVVVQIESGNNLQAQAESVHPAPPGPAVTDEDTRKKFEELDAMVGQEKDYNVSISGCGRNLDDVQNRVKPSKLRLVVPIEVLKGSIDMTLVLRKKLELSNIPFRLEIAGVKQKDEVVIANLKEKLGLNQNVEVIAINEEAIQKEIRENPTRVRVPQQLRVAAIKKLSLDASELDRKEYMMIVTDPVTTEKATEAWQLLKDQLTPNVSIRLMTSQDPDNSLFMLSRIINSWLRAIQEGHSSTIIRLPALVAPQKMMRELGEAVRAAWDTLVAA